ncbi:DEKNAAC102730, partial [Brettanomyces naardenensis]
MFLQILAVVGTVIGFVCITLSVAAGLYYSSEIIEENIEFTRRFLSRTILILSVLLVLLWLFDGFPWKLILFSLFSYYVYSLNLRQFPNVNLTGPIFISTCLLAILNHYIWFRHFSNPYIPPLQERLDPNYKMPHYASFAEIASFFGICIWLIPFALFIS